MNILHYSLGFPPYRTGGLTKYCTDLMKEQVQLGHKVSLLWPGKIKCFNRDIRIHKSESYQKISSYEIINPLPVPLLEGINRPEEYMKKCNQSIYEKFLNDVKPDIIHIHTLMGLHKEFLEVAKKKNIKIVYTSHDYFGLCPKVNLFDYENCNCNGINNKKCTQCCKNALSLKKIYLLQSRTYRILKDFSLLKILRQKVKHNKNVDLKNDNECTVAEEQIINYMDLKNYYKNMFDKIDEFYFNSKIAYEVFSNHIEIANYAIVPITHMNITDNRVKKIYLDDAKLSIGYIGPENYAKGYNTLRNILDKLQKELPDFELNVYFKADKNIPEYIITHDKYNYMNMDKVFEKLDVIIVPSNWKETFGFGVLEALSYGVPVICSKNVGASYLIKENEIGYIYEEIKQLEGILREICISKEKLKTWNDNIVSTKKLCMNMIEHTKSILILYTK